MEEETNDTTHRNPMNVSIPGHPNAVVEEDPAFWYIDGHKFFKAEMTLPQAIEKMFGTLPPPPIEPKVQPVSPEQHPVLTKRSGNSKTGLIIAFGFIVFFVILFASCPSQEQHEAKIDSILNEYLDKQLGNDHDAFSQIGFNIGQLIGKGIISSCFSVDSYGIISFGKIKMDGKSRIVTVGILNAVFPLVSAEDIEKQVNKQTSDLSKSIFNNIIPSSEDEDTP